MSRRGQEAEAAGSRRAETVTSFDGTAITFDFYPNPSRKVVLVVPGFWRSRRWPSMEQLARFLSGMGYAVAIMDVRGHGDSGGTYGFNRYEEQDVYAVARHLHELGDAEQIGVIGFSVGGSIAISAVTRHPELPWRSMMVIAGVAKFGMIRPFLNPFTMHRHISASNAMRPPRYTWRFLTSPKLCAAEDIRNLRLPISIIHVKNDWLIHHRHGVALHTNANDPKDLHILDIPGRYHADRVLTVAREETETLIREFLQRTL
jgi:pimeloyl-ACP methyl ester carboxylesterase